MNLTPDQQAKLKDERQRGTMAQQVLDNAVFVDTISRIRQKYIAAWQSAPLNDMEGQHYIRVLLAAHDSIVSEIVETMRTGQMAEASLTQNPFRGNRTRKGYQED